MSYNQVYKKDDTQSMLLPSPLLNIPKRPPFGDSFINYSSLAPAVLDSIGSGWIQIKHLLGNSTTWYPGHESWIYAGTEFLFTRGDFSAWFICDVFQAVGEYYNKTPRTIKKSSISEVSYTAIWYNRGYLLDPVLSLRDYNLSEADNTIMYTEYHHTAARGSISPSGMYVFIR